jgi:hypothetical protein
MAEMNLRDQLEQVNYARKLVQTGSNILDDTAKDIQNNTMSIGGVLEESRALDSLYDGNDYVLLMTLNMEGKLQSWVYVERANVQAGTTLVGLGSGAAPDSMRLTDCCVATAKNHQPVTYQRAGEFEDDGRNLKLKETSITEHEFASKARHHMTPEAGQRTKVFASVVKRLDDFDRKNDGSTVIEQGSNIPPVIEQKTPDPQPSPVKVSPPSEHEGGDDDQAGGGDDYNEEESDF